jgi:hypothetical protein
MNFARGLAHEAVLRPDEQLWEILDTASRLAPNYDQEDRPCAPARSWLAKLPITGELLRGSLLERTVRHTKGCPKCARGEGTD